MINFIKKYKWIIVGFIAILILTAIIEIKMGRLLFGPDGKVGLWEGNIWSSEQSQRFADPYSFSHFIHGLLFYGFLWLVARKLPLRYRLIGAILLEACWEILENSPIIINRYRSVTISLGYEGDSVFNSLSDILFVAMGFWFASKTRWWIVLAVIIVIEVATLFWIRDNLTLNIIMLIYPIEKIKTWQSIGQPL